MRYGGLDLLPPDVNESDADFTPRADAVRFGLNAIKGIGAGSVNAIIAARKNGKFTSLYDFTARVEQGSLGRRGAECLVSAGAFDSLAPIGCPINSWRSRLFEAIDGALCRAQRAWHDTAKGQNALFSSADESLIGNREELPSAPAWSQQRLSQEEKSAIGFYLSSHPLDDYAEILECMKIKKVADYPEIRAGERVALAGIVSGMQIRHSKKGNRFCIFKLEDQSNSVKCLAWSEAYEKFSDSLRDGELLTVAGKVESAEGQEITLILDDAGRLDEAVPFKAKNISITVPEDKLEEKLLEEVFALLSRNQGGCAVNFSIVLKENVNVQLSSPALRIKGSRNLESKLVELGCQVQWRLN